MKLRHWLQKKLMKLKASKINRISRYACWILKPVKSLAVELLCCWIVELLNCWAAAIRGSFFLMRRLRIHVKLSFSLYSHEFYGLAPLDYSCEACFSLEFTWTLRLDAAWLFMWDLLFPWIHMNSTPWRCLTIHVILAFPLYSHEHYALAPLVYSCETCFSLEFTWTLRSGAAWLFMWFLLFLYIHMNSTPRCRLTIHVNLAFPLNSHELYALAPLDYSCETCFSLEFTWTLRLSTAWLFMWILLFYPFHMTLTLTQ